ncbi:MAG: hypothetical protein C4539_12745 [Ignavibacteriales bacterium]|nr:MAG: hypothetical protein C4539_12745 [Ignavibacteriales bacterium]
MELAFVIFWIIVSFAICMIRCYGLLNENDNLIGKTKSEKRKNLFLFFSKIWFSSLPILLSFWIFFYRLDDILFLIGINLEKNKVLHSLIILFAGIPLILYSGHLGNRLWIALCQRYIKNFDAAKFSFWETDVEL